MGNISLVGATSGGTTLVPQATGTYTVTLPASSDTLATVSNPTFTGTVTATTVTSPSATALTIQSAGTTAMTVDTSQNVYVGNTASLSSERLLVRGVALGGTAGNTSYNSVFYTPDTLNTTRLSVLDYRVSNGTDHTTSRNKLQRRVDGTDMGYVGFDSAGTSIGWQNSEAMRIDSSGNVGIGTTSPGRKLDIEQASTDYQMRIGDAGANYYDIGRNTGNGLLTFYGSQAAASGYVFSTVNGERARIDTSGNLLVGYASSNGAYKLQVNSQIFATSSTIATSDARYKQNVQTLNGALNIVKALRPVSFDWKKHPVHAFDTENTTVGFLAQEVQQVLADKPYLNSIIKKNECVIEPEVKDENGDVTTAAVTEEFLGIAEGNMIAILTSAIQELSVKNDALEARLAALEAK